MNFQMLQPHESSSETKNVSPQLPFIKLLQPHESSSETHRDDLDEIGDFGFNLTRVRLKR